MSSQTQISATISTNTMKMVEQYINVTGVQKDFLIESALRYHLRALEELPAEIIIPPEIVVSAEAGQRMLELLEDPPEPTDAMKALYEHSHDMVIDHD